MSGERQNVNQLNNPQSHITPIIVQPQHRIYPIPSQSTETLGNYRSNQALVLGIIELIGALSAIIVQIAAIAIESAIYWLGTGIWCGVIFTVTAVLTLLSVKFKGPCTVTSSMVLNILSNVLAWVLLVFSAAGVGIDNDTCDYDSQYDSYEAKNCVDRDGVAVNSLLLIISVLFITCTLWQSILCCKSVCCGRQVPGAGTVLYTNYPPTATVSQNYPIQNGRPIFLPNCNQTFPNQNQYGQGGAVVYQPAGPSQATSTPQGAGTVLYTNYPPTATVSQNYPIQNVGPIAPPNYNQTFPIQNQCDQGGAVAYQPAEPLQATTIPEVSDQPLSPAKF